MTKKNLILAIVAAILVPLILFIGYLIYSNQKIMPGMKGISKMNVGVFYCTYNNDNIPKFADMIKSRLNAKVYQIDAAVPYPKDPDAFIKRIKEENKAVEKLTLRPYDIDLKKIDYMIFATAVYDDQPCPALKKFVIDNQDLFNNKFVSVMVLHKDKEIPANTVLFFSRKFYKAIWKPAFITKMKDMKQLNYEFDLWFNLMQFKRKELRK